MNTVNFPDVDVVLKRNGGPWNVLTFAKFFRRPFTYADLTMMNDIMFAPAKHKRTYKSITTLTENGLVDKLDDQVFQITSKGVRYHELMSHYYNTRRRRA